MARPLRIEYEGDLYHVTARGNEKRKVFFFRKDYEKFKECLEHAVEKFGFVLHGYVNQLALSCCSKGVSKLINSYNPGTSISYLTTFLV